jgi:hypothetical protein
MNIPQVWVYEIVFAVATMPVFYLWTLWFHELGHAKATELVTGVRPKIVKKWAYWYVEIPDDLSVEQVQYIISSGIVLGFLPLVVYFGISSFIGLGFGFLLLLTGYFFGCYDDIIKLYRVSKNGVM